jgi:two-component system chemotaxis response regulator CheB
MNKSFARRKIRVLIVDDSALVRQTLTEILESDPEIEIMGTAADPFAAARHIHQEVPDVITLDIEMPRMDGITFLRKVVVCSSLAESGSETLAQAWEAGAVEIIAKPKVGTAQFLQESKIRICDVVKAASRVRVGQLSGYAARTERQHGPAKKLNADAVLAPPIAGHAMARTTETVICIGASTGGTESLRVVLETLPAASPGIVIVQHMPEKFTEAFARRLNGLGLSMCYSVRLRATPARMPSESS